MSEILPWDRKSYLTPIVSYPGRQVKSSCEIASKRIQGLLEAYFEINEYMKKKMVSKKKNQLFVLR